MGFSQYIGRRGVLRDIGPDRFVRDENGAWITQPDGSILAVTKDDQYVVAIKTPEQNQTLAAGGVPQEAIVARLAPSSVAGVGRVVQMDGTKFPDTPTTITDPKTGVTVEEDAMRATQIVAGAGAGGFSRQHLLLAGGLALLWFYSRRRR